MYFFVFGILKNCLLDKNLIICHAYANIFYLSTMLHSITFVSEINKVTRVHVEVRVVIPLIWLLVLVFPRLTFCSDIFDFRKLINRYFKAICLK